ncbi:PAS domain-containing protein [Halosegnis sp.]|uniref:PAS domain-containing protein n=1 Tax=Halosegnis sp. TaxID=2864959 RepID=UPI0035D46BBA
MARSGNRRIILVASKATSPLAETLQSVVPFSVVAELSAPEQLTAALAATCDCVVVDCASAAATPADAAATVSSVAPNQPVVYIAPVAAMATLLGPQADVVSPTADCEELAARIDALIDRPVAGYPQRQHDAAGHESADTEADATTETEIEPDAGSHQVTAPVDTSTATLANITDPVVAVDADGTVTDANGPGKTFLRHVLGLASTEPVLGTRVDAADGPADAATESALGSHWQEAVRTGTVVTFKTDVPPLGTRMTARIYPGPDGCTIVCTPVAAATQLQAGYRALLETAETLFTTTEPTDIASVVVTTVVEALGYQHCCVRLVADDALQPVAASDATATTPAERPIYDLDEGLPGEALQRGEPVEVPDVAAHDVDIGLPEVQSTLTLPLGELGTISVGATTSGSFDDVSTQLLELLAVIGTAALERADRETLLQRYQTALERTDEMAFALDGDGYLTLATEALATRWGHDRDEIIGRHVLDFASRGFVESIVDRLQTTDGTVTVEATPNVTNLGVPVEILVSPITPDAPEEGVVGIVRDISALAEMRTDLERQRNRFQYLFDDLPSPAVEIVDGDDTAVIARTNARFAELFVDDEDVTGEPLTDVVQSPTEAADDAVALGGTGPSERRMELQTTAGRRMFSVRTVPFRVGTEIRQFQLYVDITDETEQRRRLEMLHRVLRHNLRNELTVIGGNARQLAATATDETTYQLAASICAAATALETLSDTSSFIRTVSTTPDRTTGPLQAVIDDAVATVRADHPDVSITTDLPSDLRVVGRTYLTRAVRELVENAVVHGAAPVTVQAGHDDTTVTVRVTDTGPGVPTREQNVVTGSLDISQVDHSSGLGLWVAHYVAEALGGRLRFENDGRTVVLAELTQA